MSNNEKPLLLMDIDGVLNVFGMRRDPTKIVEAEACGYFLGLVPEHPQMISELEKHFEIVWASMWVDRCADFGAVAGGIGQDWEFIDFHEHWEAADLVLRVGKGVVNYKLPGILATVGDRPFVYIDDDMSPNHFDWALERTDSGIPTLFLSPDASVGMTRDHVNKALAFAKLLQTGQEASA